MATGFLPPQDLLGERFHLPTTSSHTPKTIQANGNLAMRRKQHRKPSPKHDKSRPSAVADRRKSSQRYITDRQRKGEITQGSLAVEQVTLIRRGESLSSIASKIPKSSESQEIVPMIRLVALPPAEIYAGTACTSSPSPRSLPQPSFFNRKDDANSFEEGATRFLRRVLGLN